MQPNFHGSPKAQSITIGQLPLPDTPFSPGICTYLSAVQRAAHRQPSDSETSDETTRQNLLRSAHRCRRLDNHTHNEDGHIRKNRILSRQHLSQNPGQERSRPSTKLQNSRQPSLLCRIRHRITHLLPSIQPQDAVWMETVHVCRKNALPALPRKHPDCNRTTNPRDTQTSR